MAIRRVGLAGGVAALVLMFAIPVPAADLVWPTPNPAAEAGRPYEEFVQPTESGMVTSGLFGCVRTSGRQFHEGLDLRPLQRDKRGEAADAVLAMLPGFVRHASDSPGASNYGRYVVLEHREEGLPFITLYAHLLSIASETRVNAPVTAGQALGIMGRSAGNAPIPRERAHVHVEMGFYLTEKFQSWYNARKFPNKNLHGVFNGMNVVGFDFLDFVERRRAGDVQTVRDYVQHQPTAVTVVVRGAVQPDFVTRHPALVAAARPIGPITAWRIDFTWFGLPKAWWPLGADEPDALGSAGREIIFADADLLARFPCQRVVQVKGGRFLFGSRLRDSLDLLFAGL